MFPSSAYHCHFPYTNQSLLGQSSVNIVHENPNSRQDQQNEPPTLFTHFPFPFDEELLVGHHLVPQQQQQAAEITYPNMATDGQKPGEAVPVKERSKGHELANPNPRKRNGKKDRHSKIHTAQGPRDRRMRLSLTVSRKFFDLQDMLGFDKASKTIEWLFTKSKTAIKEHFTKNKPQMNSNAGKNAAAVSMFECYLAATGSEKTPARGETMVGSTTHAAHNSSSKKKNMNLRKASYNPLARESREKARARARERTKEKLKIKSLGTSNPKNMDDQLGFSGLVAAGEEEPSTCCHREKGSTIETVAQVQGDQLGPTDIIEKFLGTSSSLASCSIYDSRNNNSSNSNNNNFNGFLEDWNVDNAGMFYSDYYAIASKVSLKGNAHDQNPCSNFLDTLNIQFQSQF